VRCSDFRFWKPAARASSRWRLLPLAGGAVEQVHSEGLPAYARERLHFPQRSNLTQSSLQTRMKMGVLSGVVKATRGLNRRRLARVGGASPRVVKVAMFWPVMVSVTLLIIGLSEERVKPATSWMTSRTVLLRTSCDKGRGGK